MKPMSNKSPEMVSAIESMFPGIKEAINSKICTLCKDPITQFRDNISLKEYIISGMCQACQDEIFCGG